MTNAVTEEQLAAMRADIAKLVPFVPQTDAGNAAVLKASDALARLMQECARLKDWQARAEAIMEDANIHGPYDPPSTEAP